MMTFMTLTVARGCPVGTSCGIGELNSRCPPVNVHIPLVAAGLAAIDQWRVCCEQITWAASFFSHSVRYWFDHRCFVARLAEQMSSLIACIVVALLHGA